jgi:hypothetical protein
LALAELDGGLVGMRNQPLSTVDNFDLGRRRLARFGEQSA